MTPQTAAALVDALCAHMRAYIADPSGNNIIYLSDGGYSRLVMPVYEERRVPSAIGLVGPPTKKVADRWREIMAFTPRAQLWEGR